MNRILVSLLILSASALIAPQPAMAIVIDTVPVGNVGNPNDPATGGFYGGVDYTYRIGTTEVSNAQYAAFLNAKAASDPLYLYDAGMSGNFGGITQSGESGSYTYANITGRGDMPVNFVSWYDSIRFPNWLNNGQGSGDTETGAYTLGDLTDGEPTNGNSITRNPGATWFLTSENEWYKAAYHKNDGVTSNFFAYPTSNDAVPTAEAPPGGSNSANYNFLVQDLTNVGAYTASDSPYGTFDQGGNVFEWNEALILGSVPGLRGGSFGDSGGSGRLLSSGRTYFDDFDRTRAFAVIGFRVATVPEPSTMLLLVVGVVGIFGPRRRLGA